MFEIFSASQCREMDKQSINDVGIPGIILMENAAIGIFRGLVGKGESFLILCGKGNNGGDALALCRHLIEAGKRVRIYIVSKDENYTEDFKTNFNILKHIINAEDILFVKSEGDINEYIVDELKSYDVVVDGIFGVGLNKDLTGIFKKIIKYKYNPDENRDFFV